MQNHRTRNRLAVAGTPTRWLRALGTLCASGLFLLVVAGCGGYTPAPPEPEPKPAAAAQPPAAKTPQKPPEPLRKKAKVGVGQQGHYGGLGVIKTPISAYFRARQMIAYDIQVKHSLDLFKALEGHAPRTQEEFMDRIIKENRINLPRLPPGERYFYDVKTEQLMVEYPPPN